MKLSRQPTKRFHFGTLLSSLHPLSTHLVTLSRQMASFLQPVNIRALSANQLRPQAQSPLSLAHSFRHPRQGRSLRSSLPFGFRLLPHPHPLPIFQKNVILKALFAGVREEYHSKGVTITLRKAATSHQSPFTSHPSLVTPESPATDRGGRCRDGQAPRFCASCGRGGS
jgi:hypothetical protein